MKKIQITSGGIFLTHTVHREIDNSLLNQ